MKLKGISLSIETIIVLIICVLVLVVTTLFFSGAFAPGAESTVEQSALTRECLEWSWHKCDHTYFEENIEEFPALNKNFKGDPVKAEDYCPGCIK